MAGQTPRGIGLNPILRADRVNLGLLHRKRTFSLTGSARTTILAENTRGGAGGGLKVVASTEGPPDQEITIRRLLSAVPDQRGSVAVSLPLNFFQIATVDIPPMPDEAIRRALPYHLAKALAQPLQEFIFDWQLTRRHHDRLEVAVYLFPAASFQMLRRELARKQLELKYLEPDVFSAFAYLESTGRLAEDEAVLCTLIWPGYSSQAIYKQGRVVLVRSIPLNQPTGLFQDCLAASPTPPVPDVPAGSGESSAVLQEQPATGGDFETIFGESHQEILADFALSTREADEDGTPIAPTMPPPEKSGAALPTTAELSWPEYINTLGLEILRTRDFYGLILKGSGIGQLYVGGGEEFLAELGRVTETALTMKPLPLLKSPVLANCPSPFEALCRGAGMR